MACCCTKTLIFCEVLYKCPLPIDLPFIANVSGLHTITLKSPFHTLVKVLNLSAGDPFNFNIFINGNATYNISITEPSGTVFTYNGYDCFQFKTYTAWSISNLP